MGFVALACRGSAQAEETSAGLAASAEAVSASNADTSNGSGLINGVDSDFYFLEMRPTSLPGVQGYGVFTKAEVPSGEILCEYRGPIIQDSIVFSSDKLYTINSIQNETMKIVGDNICAYINDCIDVARVNYTRYEDGSVVIHESGIVPTIENHPYNAAPLTTRLGKVFIASISLIPAGTEVCYFYGW
jgi:hypothetical protein